MNDIDAKIREALRQEDAELFAEFEEEPSIFEMTMAVFRGRNRWLTIFFGVVWMLAVMAILVFAIVKFLDAETTRSQLAWSLVSVACMLGVVLIKTWGWLEIHRNYVTREIKRVELQIALLAKRLRNG